jgi:hypothetical protein
MHIIQEGWVFFSNSSGQFAAGSGYRAAGSALALERMFVLPKRSKPPQVMLSFAENPPIFALPFIFA